MGLLTEKVAIITGAGGGIGRAHAALFAREGARVVVNDTGASRDGSGSESSAAEDVASAIRDAGGHAIANTDDVADEAGAERLVASAVQEFGKLDILVNNAGILRDKTLRKMTVEMWDSVIRVHLRGTFLCTRAAAIHMCDRGQGGRIINTCSVSGLLGNFGQGNYAAAKAGIYGLTRTASIELKRHKIMVNALAPMALTRMTEDLPMIKAVPNAAEMFPPEAIAPAALFLASSLSDEVTGQVVAVEGKRMYIYKMTQTAAVVPRGEGWTAQEIADRWSELQGG